MNRLRDRSRFGALMLLAGLLRFVLALAGPSSSLALAGSIVVTERFSSGEHSALAGSGGAVDSTSDSDSTTALTGPFSFSRAYSASVSITDPLSLGTASASGSLFTADNVSSTPTTLEVRASRQATGMATWGAGSGTGVSQSVSETRVNFSVIGDVAQYALDAVFNPGVNNGIGTFRIGRPFASFDIVDVNGMPITTSQTGLLVPNAYQFRVRVFDDVRASSNNPSDSDTSSYSILFRLVSVPEPGGALIAIGLIMGWAARRS